MEITLMGYALIPLGALLFFFKIHYLFLFAIFFSGFTNSSVITFTDAGFTLTAPHFLFALLIVKYFFYFIQKQTLVKTDTILSSFIIICAVSLCMPIILSSSNIETVNVSMEIVKLKFSIQNITQFIYIFFSFLIYWIAKDILWNNPSRIESYMNAYFLGAFVICLIGYYEVIAYIFGLPFDVIFRDSPLGFPLGESVHAVAAEPSMLAFYAGPTLALLLFYKSGKFFMPKTMLIIMLFILSLLSKSTSFLFCVAMFSLLLLYRNMLKTKFTKENLSAIRKFFFLAITITVLFLFMIAMNQSFYELISSTFQSALDKLQIKNVSGIQRLFYAQTMFNVFLKSPIFGIGFGSSRSTDLLTTWLANVGLVGFITFLFYGARLCKNLNSTLKQKYESTSFRLSEGYIYFFILLFYTALVSVPEPYFLFIWLHLGIAESYIRILLQKTSQS